MTRDQITRAAVLCDAREDFAKLQQATHKPPSDDALLRVGIIYEICDAGCSVGKSIEIDLATAKKLLPKLRELIAAELEALGVTA